MSDAISILIVDDEPVARSRLRELLADLSPDFPHRIVGEAANAPEALSQIDLYQPQVVLLHGIWMRAGITARLAARLAASGFEVTRFDYPSIRAPFSAHHARLAALVAQLNGEGGRASGSSGGALGSARGSAAGGTKAALSSRAPSGGGGSGSSSSASSSASSACTA